MMSGSEDFFSGRAGSTGGAITGVDTTCLGGAEGRLGAGGIDGP